jgi:hypothetical protein
MTANDSVDLSIVIVAYKSKEYISRCIRSVLEATQGLSSEVIIVDNGSGDGLRDFLCTEFPKVSVIENKKNEGFARGVNQGARLASGRYLNILNPDTQLNPDTLKILLSYVAKHPSGCIIGARTINEMGRIIPSCRSLPHIGNIIKYPLLLLLQGRRLKNPKRYLLDIWEQNETIDVTRYNGYITGTCIITRLDFFKKMGMFDEGYFLYCEDIDFGFRMRQTGYHAFFVSEASMIHLAGHSASQNPMSRLYFVDAYIRYIHKNFTFLHGMAYKICLFLFVLSWVVERFLRISCKEAPILLQALRCFVPYWLGGPPRLPEHG